MSTSPTSGPDSATVAVEHYCTLFDYHFLPQGLALHESLVRHDPACILWVLCIDEETFATLDRLALPSLRLLRREAVESSEVLAIKDSRSPGEYCWTLASVFTLHLLEHYEEIPRITYLDADCYFLSSPRRLLAEMEAAGKEVLITPHAYNPEYDLSEESGVYCVQFVTFTRSEPAMAVLRNWRSQCIDWCYARSDQGRFGDQKYLDPWPELYPGTVHVLQDAHLTMAPWNVERFADRLGDACMYHFHKFRLLSPTRVMLFEGYRVSPEVVDAFYEPYLRSIARFIALLGEGWKGYLPRPTPSLGGRLSDFTLTRRGMQRMRNLKPYVRRAKAGR